MSALDSGIPVSLVPMARIAMTYTPFVIEFMQTVLMIVLTEVDIQLNPSYLTKMPLPNVHGTRVRCLKHFNWVEHA